MFYFVSRKKKTFLAIGAAVTITLASVNASITAEETPPEFHTSLDLNLDTVSSVDSIVLPAQPMKGFLRKLYDAQINLQNADDIAAKSDISDALILLERLRVEDSTRDKAVNFRDEPNFRLRKVIELRLSGLILPSRAILPVEDDELSYQEIDQVLNLKDLEAGTIRNAEVRYISLDVDIDYVRRQLISAQEELMEKDIGSALFDILFAQRSILEDHRNRNVSNRLLARDNIGLARYLLNHAEFDAAREALRRADDALARLSKENEEAKPIGNIKDSLAQLREELGRRDPSMFESIDQKLQDWWKQLSPPK